MMATAGEWPPNVEVVNVIFCVCAHERISERGTFQKVMYRTGGILAV
jgi:hypothetical protein